MECFPLPPIQGARQGHLGPHRQRVHFLCSTPHSGPASHGMAGQQCNGRDDPHPQGMQVMYWKFSPVLG